MDRVFPKTGPYPGLKPYKIDMTEIKRNIYIFQQLNDHTPEYAAQRVTYSETTNHNKMNINTLQV